MKVVHGGNRDAISKITGIASDKLIDFSANINPMGLDDKLREQLIKSLKDIVYYPDPKYLRLKDSLGTHFNVSKEDIFVGNGAVQMIFDTVIALNSQNALVLAPTFGEYERSLRRAGVQVKRFLLKKQNDFQVDVSDLLSYLRANPKIDLLCICNPNNPTGQVMQPDSINKLNAYCQKNGIWLILDEAFMDFVQRDKLSYIPYLSENSPIIIIRSATKFFAIPGLRLGFAVTKNKLLKQSLLNQSEPWSVNTLAKSFGEHMYEATDYIRDTYKWLGQEKSFLYAQLIKIPYLTVYSSKVNYYLLQSQIPKLREKLWDFGIMIRDCSDYYGLEGNYYRVAVRSHTENLKLISALQQVI